MGDPPSLVARAHRLFARGVRPGGGDACARRRRLGTRDRPARCAPRRLRGVDVAPLWAGAPPLEDPRRRGRRRPRVGGAAFLRRLGGRTRAAPRADTVRIRTRRAGAVGADHRPVPRAGSAGVTVAIVDYVSGNLHSAAKAFERAARESGRDQPILVTADPDAVRRADRVVLPGVGAFADCRRGLNAVSGMVEALEESVRRKARPFLGICVGMQLMAERGREYEVTQGFGWIPGEVDRIEPKDKGLKVPHMGWNTLDTLRAHPLLDGIATGPHGLHAYFVHSYHLNAADRDCLVAQADYGGPVTAMVARDTYAGTQFHPEKSQRLGLALIANFLKWAP